MRVLQMVSILTYRLCAAVVACIFNLRDERRVVRAFAADACRQQRMGRSPSSSSSPRSSSAVGPVHS